MASGDGSGTGRPAEQPEERKTETTLTTRIRINIPGSRPIPPVVMRTPVGDGEGPADDRPAAPAEPRQAPAASTGAAEPPAESAAPKAEDKPASDWFAPRKSGAPKGGPAAGGTNGAGTGGGSAAAGGAGARSNGSGAAAAKGGPSGPAAKGGPGGSDAPGAPGTTGARPAGRPGGVVGSMSVPGGSRPGAPKGSGLPSATGGPVAPGHGGGTGSFDVTEALAAGPLGTPRPGANGGEPSRDDLPYFSGTGQHDLGALGASGAGVGGPGGPGGPSGFSGPNGPGGPGGPQGPAGPTGGPVTGDGPLAPPAGGEPFGVNGQGGVPRSALSDLDRPTGPAGPVAVPGAGLGPGGGLSDDTAILTPQKPAPEQGVPGYPAPDNVSGHTVTSGMPVIPSAGNAPFGPDGTAPQTAPKPEGTAQPKAKAKAKKKGRSKVVLLGVGVVVVLGGAYGAGLLMNHTDVPKGTTVLGTDIGGGTRDDAVKKLDDAFGSRVNKPLKLSVGGKTVDLAPDNAGLQFDFQATVSKAATSDYNPVSVIGSLFGQKREIEPVMPVDEEKLQAALQQTGGGSGSVTEGGVEFVSGKAVPVYGKAGKAVDAAQSTQAVEQAYRTLVETGTASAVSVPTATKQPTVSNAEVDREMKTFAEPAMSGSVIVRTDATHYIKFSPQNSLWKFLRVTAVNGKLVDSPDLNALKGLYGQTFDGVLITRGTGKKTAVTPQDVYVALRQALLSTTHRDVVMDTNPS